MRSITLFLTIFVYSICQIAFGQSYINNTPFNFSGTAQQTVVLPVTGLQTSGKEVKQVRLKMGNATSDRSADLANATIKLKSPSGLEITLIDAGTYGTTYSNVNNRSLNITFRDHTQLHTPASYASATSNVLSYAYPFNYGYWRAKDNFNGFTGDLNGNWELLIEYSSMTGTREFIEFELVFDDIGWDNIINLTSSKPNQSCSTRECISTGNIYYATNIGYPTGQGLNQFYNISGCQWNGDDNSAIWFYFIPTSTTVELSFSGLSKRLQSIVIKPNISNPCNFGSFTVPNGGCPSNMSSGTANHTQYYNQPFTSGGGISQNHGYTLTGLTVGEEYILVIDGEASATSDFYLEVKSGVDGTCCVQPDAPQVSVVDPTCNDDGTASISNYVSVGNYIFSPVGPSVDATGNITGATFGQSYSVVYNDGICDSPSANFTIEAQLPTPAAPVVDVTPADCDGDGTATINGYDSNLTYNLTTGTGTIEADGSITGVAGNYAITVTENGCTSSETPFTIEAQLPTPAAPIISIVDPTCDVDGSAEITNYNSGVTYVFNPTGPNFNSTTGDLENF
ncbi:MAG: hypothetical protein WC994_10100, partial [Brumimicrobium sp.]